MESISHLRQMMADQKFFEVQRLLEVQLSLNSEARSELLALYFETLSAQQKKMKSSLLLEFTEIEFLAQNYDFVLLLLKEINPEDFEKYFFHIQKLKIQTAEAKGQLEELYALLNEYMLKQFEKKCPATPEWLSVVITKYFNHDFNLKLKDLALCLSRYHFEHAESITRELIIACVEKSSPRGIADKIISIGEILKTCDNKGTLEIYQNFCFLSVNGLSAKAEIKRIVEMIIYYDDFKFQILVLSLLHNLKLTNEANEYAEAIRKNPQYDFVYLDKFFGHLKGYFFKKSVNTKAETSIQEPPPDLKLNGSIKSDIVFPILDIENDEDEQRYFNQLKYQIYSLNQLCDLSVSFLQSQMPRVAMKAAELAIEKATQNSEFLKASYLKLTCQLSLKDYRAALDTCFVSISKAGTKDDILSFLYAQAEIYIRLNQKRDAKSILQKILSVDSKYRLAQERLEKLNEI